MTFYYYLIKILKRCDTLAIYFTKSMWIIERQLNERNKMVIDTGTKKIIKENGLKLEKLFVDEDTNTIYIKITDKETGESQAFNFMWDLDEMKGSINDV